MDSRPHCQHVSQPEREAGLTRPPLRSDGVHGPSDTWSFSTVSPASTPQRLFSLFPNTSSLRSGADQLIRRAELLLFLPLITMWMVRLTPPPQGHVTSPLNCDLRLSVSRSSATGSELFTVNTLPVPHVLEVEMILMDVSTCRRHRAVRWSRDPSLTTPHLF